MLSLPQWYLSSILSPLAGGALTLIPAIGTLCLVAGLAVGVRRRQSKLLLFLVPVALSEALVVLAWAWRGQVREPDAILLAFIAIQFLIGAYLVYSLKGARMPAVALAIFSITYAVFAAFTATMSFRDNWL